jgi:hypothetical protein
VVTQLYVAEALDRQKLRGGRLGDMLVSLNRLAQADLDAVLNGAPAEPTSIAETELRVSNLKAASGESPESTGKS